MGPDGHRVCQARYGEREGEGRKGQRAGGVEAKRHEKEGVFTELSRNFWV